MKSHTLSLQAQKVLKAIRGMGPEGISPARIEKEYNVTQPNARIFEIRKHFGCTCKSKLAICFAQEHIVNKMLGKYKGHRLTRYYYTTTANPIEWIKDARKPVIHDDAPQLF